MPEQNIITGYSSADHGRVPSQLIPLILITGAFAGICVAVFTTRVFNDPFTWVHLTVASLVGAFVPYFLFRRRGLKKNKRFIASITEKVNMTILEVTGDPSQKLTPERVQSIMQGKSTEPLAINGINGIELANESVSHHYAEDTNAIVLRTQKTENGVSSFDRLVASAAEKNPDIKAVSNEYRIN